MLIQEVQKEIERIDMAISQLEKELTVYPTGDISCGQNGKYTKCWLINSGHPPIYLKKQDYALAEKLAVKKYKSSQLEDLKSEKHALEAYLKHRKNSPSKAEALLQKNPFYINAIKSNCFSFSNEIYQWQNASYDKNPYHPEKLTHHSLSGNIVRSKSEQLIDTTLFTHGIPFRYECRLDLGENTLYPDFTALNLTTNMLFLWEHLGMMDDAKYANNAFEKMKLYNSYGYYPNINLIITSETKDHPLSPQTVENIIKMFLL